MMPSGSDDSGRRGSVKEKTKASGTKTRKKVSKQTLKERERIAQSMRELRERIYARVGNIPDIEGLIDAGRDTE